jgi:hypothetical protein
VVKETAMLLQEWLRATGVALASGMLVLLWGCGGGSVGDDADGASPPAQHQDPGGAGTPDAALDAGIVLAPPTGQDWNGGIALTWNGDAPFTRFSVWLAPSDIQDFHEVAGGIAGNAAVVTRGASWKLDFPTARIRVRGCDAAGTTCADSNEQLLAQALMDGVTTVWPRPSSSTPGGHSRYQLSRDGRRLAAARSTDMGMFGTAYEAFDPAQIDVLSRNDAGGWSLEGTIYTPDPRGVTRAMALSGDGNTLAINLYYSWSPWTVDPNEPGIVVIYVRDDIGNWTLQAAIRANDTFGQALRNLGSQLALSRDGRRLAAASEAGILVFEREADGRWQHDSTIASLSDKLAMSADGKVIATTYAAGLVSEAGYPRPYHAVRIFARDCKCTGWRQRADLHSRAYPYAEGFAALDEFGLGGLALDDGGTTLAVGAPHSGSGTPGAVYVFGLADGVWQERGFLQNQAETGNDRFGRYVSLSGDGRMLAGSACGHFAPVQGVNRNYAEGFQPLSQCRLIYRGPDLTHGAYMYRADEAGAWQHAASVVPPMPFVRNEESRSPDGDLMVPMISGDAQVLVMGNMLSLGGYGIRPDSGIFSY